MPIEPMPYAARINRLLQFTVTKNSPSGILAVISTFTGPSAAKFPGSHWVVLVTDERLIMLVVDKNSSRVKCFLKFLFELSGGFACAITEREKFII